MALVDSIKEDIDRVFSNTKVPVSQTVSDLRDIRDHVESLLETLAEGGDDDE